MTNGPVIVGASTGPFLPRSEQAAENLAAAALFDALSDGGLDLADVDLFIFGSRFEHPAIGQRVLAELGPTGAPVLNTENACASGTVALEIAIAYLRSGMADVVAVVGVERPSQLGSSSIPLPEWDRLGRAGVTHPIRYALEASKYCADTASDPRHLAGVTVKNRFHAARNPRARFTEAVSLEEVLASPLVAEPLTRLQCCANADGAAAIVLATAEAARRLDGQHVAVLGVATGSGLRTDRRVAVPLTARVAARAFEEAAVGPADVDVAEVYDAFSILEVLSTEQLGFATSGTAADRIVRGEFRLGSGGLVTNPGGGLLGRGHPLGASGVAQVVEIVDQLRGRAGDRQVPGARVGLVHTLGGNHRALEANASTVVVLAR